MEAVYQECLQIELAARGVVYAAQVELPIFYKGQRIETFYRADLVCFESLIVELKAITELGTIEQAQLLNYLKATGYRVGLLLNFGAKSLEHKRLVF